MIFWEDISFEDAFLAYDEKDYLKADSLIRGHEDALSKEENGCELMISVFALLEGRAKELEKVSVLCLAKSSGIAYEGYGKALTDQGRSEEALIFLTKNLPKISPSDRVYGALAHLAILKKDYEAAGQFFLKAIEVSSIPKTWQNRALKFAGVAQTAGFRNLPSTPENKNGVFHGGELFHPGGHGQIVSSF